MRKTLLILALLAIAAPAEAQRSKGRSRDKITADELAEYGAQTILEIIPKARPQYFMPSISATQHAAEQTMSGNGARLIVFVGTQRMGDSSTLAYYKASDVEEVRYFRPGNAGSPDTGGTSFVIQVLLKDALKKE